MDADAAEMLDDFVSGPLVTWMQTLESLMNSRSDQPHFSQEKRHECPKEYFLGLISGDFLIHTMEIIDQIPGGGRPPWNEQTDEARRLQMLQTLVRRLRGFYQNDLQQLILSPPPNIHLLARDPLTVQAMTEMRKLVLLLLGSAVQVLRGGGILDFMAASSESLASVMSDALQKAGGLIFELGIGWEEKA
ncbi:Daple-like protein [Varanus komodoensis]|nr:Daple-like protein [Varanus komodoensis]